MCMILHNFLNISNTFFLLFNHILSTVSSLIWTIFCLLDIYSNKYVTRWSKILTTGNILLCMWEIVIHVIHKCMCILGKPYKGQTNFLPPFFKVVYNTRTIYRNNTKYFCTLLKNKYILLLNILTNVVFHILLRYY